MSEWLNCVDDALNKLYAEQVYLITNEVHERSIVFWFGVYLNDELKNSEYKNFNLDFEYNKNHSNPKKTTNFPKGTYPDLILHKRGSNKDNILMIEFKTWWDDDNVKDINKLKDFTNQDGEYRYKIGYSIILNKSRKDCKITKVINGEVYE